jgi:hypothetical protein
LASTGWPVVFSFLKKWKTWKTETENQPATAVAVTNYPQPSKQVAV